MLECIGSLTTIGSSLTVGSSCSISFFASFLLFTLLWAHSGLISSVELSSVIILFDSSLSVEQTCDKVSSTSKYFDSPSSVEKMCDIVISFLFLMDRRESWGHQLSPYTFQSVLIYKITISGPIFGPPPLITFIRYFLKLPDNLWRVLLTDIYYGIPCLFSFLWPWLVLETQRGNQTLYWFSQIYILALKIWLSSCLDWKTSMRCLSWLTCHYPWSLCVSYHWDNHNLSCSQLITHQV